LSILLSSWADPEFGEKIYQTMDGSLDYLKIIHNVVRQIARESDLNPMQLCAKLAQKLNLPAGAVNPLVALSLQSNLKE